MFRYRLLTVGIIIVAILAVGFIGTAIAGTRPPVTEAYNQNNLIRLHIIANSNSEMDQAVKIKVRDRIIALMEPLLLKVEDPRKAERIISQNIDRIQAAAEAELKSNGLRMAAQVRLKDEFFPERVYPFGVLPAGCYHGLIVTLGNGAGRNWWCVLYPPLCLLDPEAPALKKSGRMPVKVEYRLLALEQLIKNKGLNMDDFWTSWAKYFGIL